MIGLTEHEKDLAADGGDLASVLTQLNQAQAFLASHMPPVSKHYPVIIGRCCDSPAEVDAIAAQLGIKAEWISPRHYWVEKRFGTAVCYRAAYIIRDAEDAPPLASAA